MYCFVVKYALGLELSDPSFDASVLSEFRTRLMEGHAEEQLLTVMLTLFKERSIKPYNAHGLVPKRRSSKRSTHTVQGWKAPFPKGGG